MKKFLCLLLSFITLATLASLTAAFASVNAADNVIFISDNGKGDGSSPEKALGPGSNYNDESIAALSRGNYFLTFIGTVILVPLAEECFYRGLIFRNLYRKSPLAAYLISMLAFACIHILGYIGQYSPLELVMAVLQYLPAGLCLAWSYIRGDTILAPILIHAAVNYVTIRSM